MAGTVVVRKTLKIYALTLVVLGLVFNSSPANPPAMSRFFHSGDGHIRLASEKNGKTFSGRYRNKEGEYSDEAYNTVAAVFGAPNSSQDRILSLRLIELMDYLQDRLGPGALLTITSGYRPPEYNANLRKRGALAAKASLHQYGMAADFFLEGVPSKRIWNHVRSLGFGGTGYYHGKTVHVDVGPARFWDENSSGVGTGLSDDNKLIGVVTDFDLYRPGDWVRLTFIRMTAFPILVDPEFMLIPMDQTLDSGDGLRFRPDMKMPSSDKCVEYSGIRQMALLRWRLPADIQPGRYLIRARFCGKSWEKMPEIVSTPAFEIRLP